MTLSDKQKLFTRLLPGLFWKAHQLGFEITLGDAYRDARVFGDYGEMVGYGAARSNHKLRLAINLNLFRDGLYLMNTDDHRELGEWWEKQHRLCRWGGQSNDGNHYSLLHRGYY